MFTIEMLPAGCGDCFWLEYGNPGETRIILIDGGVRNTATRLKERILNAQSDHKTHISPLHIELLVVTHYDNDHINGILELLESQPLLVTFGDIWFNGDRQLANLPAILCNTLGNDEDETVPSDFLGDLSSTRFPPDILGAKEGDRLSRLIVGRNLLWNKRFNGEAVMLSLTGSPLELDLLGGLKLTLLGPSIEGLHRLAIDWQKIIGNFNDDTTQVPSDWLGRSDTWPPQWEDGESGDPSVSNGSSIAFLAEYQGRSILMPGDCHASDLVKSLDRLQEQRGSAGEKIHLDAFKLAHHGSAHNLSRTLLEKIDCQRYLISTDGSSQKHPDHLALLRILRYSAGKPCLLFNYYSETTRNWGENKHQVIGGVFQDYDTEFPKNNGEGLVVDI